MKNFLVGLKPLNTDLASLLLRLLVGGLFIWHGWMKIESYHIYLPMFKDFLGIGTKLSYNLLIFAEFFCGIFVTLGFLTRLAIIPIGFSMGVAYFMALAKESFEKKELVFLFLGLSLIIFIMGSGKYSADKLLFNKKMKQHA